MVSAYDIKRFFAGMIDFLDLKERLEPRLEADLFVQSVETEGSSLEAAVQEAALLLGIPVRHIEYETIERGFPGFFGKRVKPWKIKAYAKPAEIDEPSDDEEDVFTLPEAAESEVIEADGQVFVQLRKGDVLLKVTPPAGKGKPATEAEARGALERRRILGYNDILVRQAVKDMTGSYVRVAAFQHNPANDSFVRIEISEDEMSAYVLVTPPGVGGGDISYEGLKRLLNGDGVIYGIKEDVLAQCTDRPTYGTRVCVAEGKPAMNGKDAHMDYFFEVDPSSARFRETTVGAVNFKDLNIIQNVMTGDKLARKMPPEKGEHGRTVTGKLLSATDGKDIPLPLGENVSVDKDGLTIIAGVNGRVVLSADKVGVEKVFTVDGSVGVKTGNIIFLGSVVVNGNVEEGYSIKATGNIEVTGLVEKADLDSEGDIIIRQGIAGKEGTVVRAGQTLIAKFIENATVKCGGTVIVSDGILNSAVSARQRVICQGKRAAIIGGRICAGEEIQSKILGSSFGGTETICEVGYDPDLKEHIDMLMTGLEKTQKVFNDLQRNISTLEKMKGQMKQLSEDKEAYLAELLDRRIDVVTKVDRLNGRIRQAQEQLAQVENNGKVSVSAKCHPGTVIFIRDVRTAIRSEYKSVTFTASNGLIQIGKFVDENEKAPGGKPQK
jgi:uncharacterized protein (DUF342 family)